MLRDPSETFFARMRSFFFTACCFLLLVPCSAFAQEVKEVRIDLNSKPASKPADDDANGPSALADEDELAALRRQVRELKAQLDNRLKRNEVATALASVTLKLSEGQSLSLADEDRMELLNVKFMNAIPSGFLKWNAIGPATKSSTAPNSDGANPPITTAEEGAESGAPAPDSPAVPALDAGKKENEVPSPKEKKASDKSDNQELGPPEQEEYKATFKFKDGRMILESEAPMSPVVAAADASNPSDMTFSGGLLTYQQPIFPWKIIYQRESQTLRQWVHYANFTDYPWDDNTNILISDRNTLGVDAFLKFQPVAPLEPGRSAIQKARAYTINGQEYTLELIKGKSLASKNLVLEKPDFLPPGEFREGFQPYTDERRATPIDTNILKVGTQPNAYGKASKWNEPQSFEAWGLELGVFQFKVLRKSSFSLRNDDDAGPALLRKKADGWTVSSPGWETNEGYHELKLEVFDKDTEKNSIDVFEINNVALDFYKPEDFETLSEIAESLGDTSQSSKFNQALSFAVSSQLTIVANEKAVEEATPQRDKLSQQYDNLELSNDPRVDNAIRNTLRSIWERRNALSAKIANLQSQNEVLKAQIRAALFTGISGQVVENVVSLNSSF